MTIPTDIDSEAIRLLEESDWPWSNWDKAFIESRNPERETTEDYRRRSPNRISYAELKDHGLANSSSTEVREAGMIWLRGKLAASSR